MRLFKYLVNLKVCFIVRSVAALCWVSWPDGEHHLHLHPLKVETMAHSYIITHPATIGKNHKIGPSEVRATSGQHLGGHYFR